MFGNNNKKLKLVRKNIVYCVPIFIVKVNYKERE